ncbi:MAG: hypothetical protein KC636_18890, partial [Myxococcales bacterium]|nr:hypothetical protein [Myxococcales bacterium]
MRSSDATGETAVDDTQACLYSAAALFWRCIYTAASVSHEGDRVLTPPKKPGTDLSALKARLAKK